MIKNVSILTMRRPVLRKLRIYKDWLSSRRHSLIGGGDIDIVGKKIAQ